MANSDDISTAPATDGQAGAQLRVSTHYLGEAGAEYTRQRLADENISAYRFEAEYFAPYIRTTDRLLDFGCGSGAMLMHCAPFARHADGLEVNKAAAAIAWSRGFTVYPSLAALPSASDPTARYDIVVTNHVLEHIPDAIGTLIELRRHIRPGGLLVVKIPIDDFRTARQREWRPSDIDFHLHTWTPLNFGNTLVEAGYKPRECRVITSAASSRLMFLKPFGLHKLGFRVLSIFLKRRQVFAVAEAP